MFAIAGFVIMGSCRKMEQPAELALVCSIPWRDDAFSARVGMTDSLIYIVKFKNSSDDKYHIQLVRIPLNNPLHADSSSVSSDWVDSLSSGPDFEGMRLPKANWIISPLPIGDTSRMLRFGSSGVVISAGFNQEKLQQKLREIGDLFYIVDVESTKPSTIASFEGCVFDALDHYFIMQTGIRFMNDNAGYSVYSGRYNAGGVDFTKSECLAVDLSNMKITARIKTPIVDSEAFTDWPKQHMMLDADDKLLVIMDDPARRKCAVPEVYLIEKNLIMSDHDYYAMLDKVFEKEKTLLSRLHSIGLVRDFSWFTDLIFRRWIPFRAYGIGHYPQDVQIVDLASGDITTKKLMLFGGSVANTVGGFRMPDGKTLYLLTPGISNSFYYPMANLPRNFNHVPALYDLESPPVEIKSFKRFRLHAPLWELSPERRWLILYRECKDDRFKDVILVPREALWDSTTLDDYEKFTCIHDVYCESRLDFLPGEDFVYVREKWGPESKILYECQKGNSLVILAPGEAGIRDVFFSPNGHYVGYIAKIEGKEGFWLEVRRLPE